MWVIKMNKKTIILLFAILISLSYFIFSYLNNGFGNDVMMFHHGYSTQSNFMYYTNGIFLWLGFSSLLILLFINKERSNGNQKYLTNILDTRLSRGEITIEEYKEIKDTIEKKIS
jgi:uncharacterized membrane protein